MPAELDAIRDALADAEIRIAVMERELDVARSESASLRKLLKDQADLTESVKQARDWYQDRLAKAYPGNLRRAVLRFLRSSALQDESEGEDAAREMVLAVGMDPATLDKQRQLLMSGDLDGAKAAALEIVAWCEAEMAREATP